MKKKVYDIVKENILKKLEDAQCSGEKFHWVKPWAGGADFPCAYETSIPYRGINALLLDAGEYITYKKIKNMNNPNIRLKKDAKRYPLFFFSYPDNEEKTMDGKEDEEKKRKPVFQYYTVYHISDVENLESKFSVTVIQHSSTTDTDRADSFIRDYCNRERIRINTVQGSSRAFYSPRLDEITLPDKEQFKSLYEYYSTCFHELVHSTGRRLDRKMSGKSDKVEHAKEELVAEIGASMLCTLFHIIDDSALNNSVAYIQSWAQFIKQENSHLVVHAASKAQKACDLILGRCFDKCDLDRVV